MSLALLDFVEFTNSSGSIIFQVMEIIDRNRVSVRLIANLRRSTLHNEDETRIEHYIYSDNYKFYKVIEWYT